MRQKNPDMVVICGKMTAGKTTVSDEFKRKGYKVVSVATPIKALSTHLIDGETDKALSLLTEVLKSEERAKDALIAYIGEFAQNFAAEKRTGFLRFLLPRKKIKWTRGDGGDYVKTDPYRRLTQTVASMLRKPGEEDPWIRYAAETASKMAERGEKVVCDDMRLRSEKEIFERKGFVVVRLDISPEEQRKRILAIYGKIDEKLLSHPTEIDLDGAEFDLRVDASLPPDQIQKTVFDYLGSLS